MRKQGYRHSTVKYCIQALKSIARKASLLRPESAKSYLASAPISESRKAKLTEDLARVYAYKRIPFDKPNYKRIEKLPFVPLEVEVDQLISSCGRKVATILQLIKETGMMKRVISLQTHPKIHTSRSVRFPPMAYSLR